ncbi:MAG: hypothetical protein ABF868_04260 [Sporolactobacillus sp.]
MSTAVMAHSLFNQKTYSDAHWISTKERGRTMLHFSLFAFDITICLHRISPVQRYRDDQRIKQLTDRLTDERIRLNRRTW